MLCLARRAHFDLARLLTLAVSAGFVRKSHASSPQVSAKNAKQAAEELVSRLQIPAEESESDFQLVTFASEEDCRFFYPRRALEWQRQVNTYISRALRLKRIRVRRMIIGPMDYNTWRGNRDDSSELRRQFADQHLRFLWKHSLDEHKRNS
jgi:hypothetical protein